MKLRKFVKLRFFCNLHKKMIFPTFMKIEKTGLEANLQKLLSQILPKTANTSEMRF